MRLNPRNANSVRHIAQQVLIQNVPGESARDTWRARWFRDGTRRRSLRYPTSRV